MNENIDDQKETRFDQYSIMEYILVLIFWLVGDFNARKYVTYTLYEHTEDSLY